MDYTSKARCDKCPLQKYHAENTSCKPIPIEINKEGNPLIILTAPTKRSMELGRPAMGEDGEEIITTIRAAGYTRASYDYTHVVACRYPSGDKVKFDAEQRSRNRKAKGAHAKRVAALRRAGDDAEADALDREGAPHEWNPVDCCAPRLQAEISHYRNVLPLGSDASAVVLPGRPKILAIRGGPAFSTFEVVDEEGVVTEIPLKVLPSVDYQFIQKNPHYREVAVLDFKKAQRHFTDTLDWPNLNVIRHPDAAIVEHWLAKWKAEGKPIAVDTETTFEDPLRCKVRCIGFGVSPNIIIVGFHSKEASESSYYDFYAGRAAELDSILDCIRRYALDNSVRWVGHNFRVFDRMAWETNFNFSPLNVIDTILLSHLANNELPRRLGFRGSIYCDVPAWKAEHAAAAAETDEEEHGYCATDVAVTDVIGPPLLRDVKNFDQLHLYSKGKRLQDLAVGMHKLGLQIDNRRLYWHYINQSKKRSESLAVLKSIAGEDHNPNSTYQVREFLFDIEDCYIFVYTIGGDPSTNETALRQMLFSPLTSAIAKKYIRALMQYRKANKVIGTYIKPLSIHGYQVHYDPTTGLGWIFPNYNATGTKTSRFSSDGPNVQNIPEFLTDIFVAGPGYKFIYYDFDQLELRMVVALAQAELYIKAMKGEPVFGRLFEPHNLTGFLIFGEAYAKLEGAPLDMRKKGKKGSQFYKTRTLIKTMYYLFQFAGGAEKMMASLMEAEDDDGNPLYEYAFTDEGIRKVRVLLDKLKGALPAIVQYWRTCQRFHRTNGFIEEPIWKRRRRVPNKKLNEIVNFPAQAGGFAVVCDGMFAMVDGPLPFDHVNSTGMVMQTHDSVVGRIRDLGEEANEVKRLAIEESLSGEYLGMPFTGEAKVQDRVLDIDMTKIENAYWEYMLADTIGGELTLTHFDVLLNEKELKEREEDNDGTDSTYN